MHQIRRCTMEDLYLLQAISRETYFDTFAVENAPENMEAYLDTAYDKNKLSQELSNRNSFFFFLYADGDLAGYLKLNEAPAQTDVHDPASLEVERIYVKKAYQGKGLGGKLMQHAITEAYARKKACIWLGVWEKNQKAIQFYKSQGFYEIGTHPFVMGEDVQTDYLLRKDLA